MDIVQKRVGASAAAKLFIEIMYGHVLVWGVGLEVLVKNVFEIPVHFLCFE